MNRLIQRILDALIPVTEDFLSHPRETSRGWFTIARQNLLAWASKAYSILLQMIRFFPARFWRRTAVIFLATLTVVIISFSALMIWVESAIDPAPAPDRIVYQAEQGWGESPSSYWRNVFYHTPQGSFVKGIRYDWIEQLERPWSTRRFAEPEYMRAYGFIVDEARVKGNELGLPVGFAGRFDADSGEMLLDVTCAVCHTGELEFVSKGQRTSVRIDGGSGHHDLFTQRPGYFAGDLIMSMISTYVNPMKWWRFRKNVLALDEDRGNSGLLRARFADVLWNALALGAKEIWKGIYPVAEGYGRTDGLGRIGNNAFAVNITDDNYKVANAPVSYPPVWNMWKFNLVQYMGSVRQPMARNVGESLGTGARYFLRDPYGRPVQKDQRFNSSTLFANLLDLEVSVRKLEPPCWPEDVFGKVDRCKATKGMKLFQQHCAGCHGVRPAYLHEIMRDAPGKIARRANGSYELDDHRYVAHRPHWILNMIPIEDVGTDPQSALNFVNDRVDLTKTGLKATEIREAMEPYYREDYSRQVAYFKAEVNALQACALTSRPATSAATPTSAKDKEGSICRDHPDQCLCASVSMYCEKTPILCRAASNKYEHCKVAGGCQSERDNALIQLKQLTGMGAEGYIDKHLGAIDVSKLLPGAALNYIIKLMRDRAYQVMGLNIRDSMESDLNSEEHAAQWDGYGQLDIPMVAPQYKARPLSGIWATPPFLHNGSVPSVYQLLLPAYARPVTFYRKSQVFDPANLGFESSVQDKNAFLFDTTITGNSNAGHEFRADYKADASPRFGVIGPELSEDERFALIEYLKVHRDDLESQSCAAQIAQPAEAKEIEAAIQAACPLAPAAAKPANARRGAGH